MCLACDSLLFMSGDDPGKGDHPETKPVFDSKTTEMLSAATVLDAGRDMSGSELKGAPASGIR